jgi:hypothetical protein
MPFKQALLRGLSNKNNNIGTTNWMESKEVVAVSQAFFFENQENRSLLPRAVVVIVVVACVVIGDCENNVCGSRAISSRLRG